MAKRGSRRRRSVREWCVRLALAGAAGWIGYLSVMQSLAVALPDNQVERAYSLAPNNGRIAARLSEKLSGPEASSADRARAVRVAQAALRRDPTAVEAAATLGFDALGRGDEATAKRLFTYSQMLSRRDLRTQLWAIEDAVAREDIAGALKHYDIALRTKKNAPNLLYPVLSSAATDPAIRAEFVRLLSGQPLWARYFIEYLAANNSDPGAVAALFRELQHSDFPVSERARNTVINALLVNDQFNEAWSYYTTFRKGIDRRTSRDDQFKVMAENPSSFDWIPVNTAGISTAIQRGSENGVFDFAVSPSVGGILLQQLQLLPAGKYVLQGHSTGIEQPPESRPYWSLSCRGGGELGRVEMPNSSEAGGQFGGRFTVPADCPAQVLALVARSSSEIVGIAGQIDRVSLHPSR